MALDALIAKLEAEKVTKVTGGETHLLPLEAAPRLEVTEVSRVTSENLLSQFRGEEDSRHLPKVRAHKPALLRMLAGKSDPSITDLDALAASIAAAHGVTVAQCLSILDEDDREAIRTGSDPGRANAWRAAVASLVFRGGWKPTPPPPGPVLVACDTCAHARPVAPGLVDCAALVPSPAAVGPYRRWGKDRHVCEEWQAQNEQLHEAEQARARK